MEIPLDTVRTCSKFARVEPWPHIIPNPPEEEDEASELEAEPLYYMLRRGEISGPFSVKKITELVALHVVKADDFFQCAGSQYWLPFATALGGGTGEGRPAPRWSVLVSWVWIRLRYNLDEQSVAAGWACLGIACFIVTVSQWRFLFWWPALGGALVAAVLLILRGRVPSGGLLLVAVGSILWASSLWMH